MSDRREYRASEVADLFGVSPSTVYRWGDKERWGARYRAEQPGSKRFAYFFDADAVDAQLGTYQPGTGKLPPGTSPPPWPINRTQREPGVTRAVAEIEDLIEGIEL